MDKELISQRNVQRPPLGYLLSAIFCLFLGVFPALAHADEKVPELLLAQVFHDQIKLEDYWISEKLDGVRAYWDGTELITRRGNRIHAPHWFVDALPKQHALDGELWMGRARFDEVSAAIRRQQPNEREWRGISYQVFDLPMLNDSFIHRYARLQRIIADINSPFVQAIQHSPIDNHAALKQRLNDTVAAGGEGLMLRRKNSYYQAGRSDDLLKLKLFLDAEATVLEHLEGQGRIQGLMGSMRVKTDDGRTFRIGSGFSDDERRNPPPIGSIITYRYTGLTANGLPRFATFLRRRDDY